MPSGESSLLLQTLPRMALMGSDPKTRLAKQRMGKTRRRRRRVGGWGGDTWHKAPSDVTRRLRISEVNKNKNFNFCQDDHDGAGRGHV